MRRHPGAAPSSLRFSPPLSQTPQQSQAPSQPQSWTCRPGPHPFPLTAALRLRSQALPLRGPRPCPSPGEKLTTEIGSLPSVWIATRSLVSESSSNHL